MKKHIKGNNLDSSKVTLRASVSRLNLPGTKCFELHCFPDYVNYTEDDNFWIDMYAELLHGYGILLILETNVKELYKKRKILPDKPLVYYANERVTIFKKHIDTHAPHWQWCERVIQTFSNGHEYPNKVMFVFSQIPDRKLVELNYNEDTPEPWFHGYAEQQMSAGFEDLIQKTYQNDYVPAITIATSEIFILEKYYTKSQLIERVAKIVEKYNKTLEVII